MCRELGDGWSRTMQVRWCTTRSITRIMYMNGMRMQGNIRASPPPQPADLYLFSSTAQARQDAPGKQSVKTRSHDDLHGRSTSGEGEQESLGPTP